MASALAFANYNNSAGRLSLPADKIILGHGYLEADEPVTPIGPQETGILVVFLSVVFAVLFHLISAPVWLALLIPPIALHAYFSFVANDEDGVIENDTLIGRGVDCINPEDVRKLIAHLMQAHVQGFGTTMSAAEYERCADEKHSVRHEMAFDGSILTHTIVCFHQRTELSVGIDADTDPILRRLTRDIFGDELNRLSVHVVRRNGNS